MSKVFIECIACEGQGGTWWPESDWDEDGRWIHLGWWMDECPICKGLGMIEVDEAPIVGYNGIALEAMDEEPHFRRDVNNHLTHWDKYQAELERKMNRR